MENRNILVTGGAGYIGSQTCKALFKAGYTPVTIDNLVYGHRSAVRWGPFVEGDLAEEELLCHVMHKYNVQGVMHFAAYAYVGESVQSPGKYFSNNVTNTINLLNAMVCCGVRKIVFSSSCATYGFPRQMPIAENHPQKPVSPYGESKLFIEKALRWYGNAHAIQSVSLRYFNAAGADQEGDIGEDHDPETHLVPLVIESSLTTSNQVKILGTDYNTHDGTAVRDYIHVTDLSAAHIMALDYLSAGGNSIAVNLGTGRGYSVREVINMVEDVSGNKINVKEASRRNGDPSILVAKCDLAKELLNWEPQCSDLRNIITTAYNWHQKHHEDFSEQITESTIDKFFQTENRVSSSQAKFYQLHPARKPQDINQNYKHSLSRNK
jgi:UDP-glucose-4-epimerase GalE